MNSWLLYKGGWGSRCAMSQSDFCARFSEELIDNNFDGVSIRERRRDDIEITPPLMNGVGAHRTPSTRKRKRADGSVTNASLQGRSKVCKNGTKSKYVCSGCRNEGSSNMWLCHSDTGRDCLGKHLSDVHLQE